MIRQVRKKMNFSSFKSTKIVATVGPASSDEKTLMQMIKAGMSVARLNFSHGSYEAHEQLVKTIRKLSEELKTPVAILQDLCGPKIRLSHFEEPVRLKRNKYIKLAVDRAIKADLYTDFAELPRLVKKNETILLDDGYIELKVTAVEEKYIECRVKVPGLAKSRKGINLPDTDVSIPVFTPKDRADLAFGLEQKVDYVAMSFVESANNIVPIREMMTEASLSIPVIAKIERPVALKNIDSIIAAFDGIMVARGDLGVEVAPEEVPIIQKKLIHLANFNNKLVITATQMLESMMNNPRPTRAESSDVSNAILDGTDAVMLSGETAAGKYPVKAVNMMKRIALITENSKLYPHSIDWDKNSVSYTEAIVKSAAEIAEDLKAKYIMVFTHSGHTALELSKTRPTCPILAFTPNQRTVRKMAAFWGVSPHLIEYTPDTDEMIQLGNAHIKEDKLVKSGDLVVIVSGVTRNRGATNMLRIQKID
ncbi:MAG: pyruvate kinase [bacterium]|nr:pyruvate kinase [bacterium]